MVGDMVAWNGPQQLAVVTWGSSSCPALPLKVEGKPGNKVTVTVGLTVPSNSLCTADMAATTSIIALPAGINPNQPVIVTVTGNNKQGRTVTLPAEGTAKASSPSAAFTTAGTPSATPTLVTVTTPADCQWMVVGHAFEPFPLSVQDNGGHFAMIRCQGLGVELLHDKSDGCGWTTVQSSDEAVLAIAAIPLPAPPPGGTWEDYQAVAPGHATLTSTLACPNGTVSARWMVTVVVTH
ncbi:MAG TPA: hypothetical protein VEK76_06050 [Candidatus Binatia bacterium]|nr:hypothetical protein [Candidatus Binatia bacterium]